MEHKKKTKRVENRKQISKEKRKVAEFSVQSLSVVAFLSVQIYRKQQETETEIIYCRKYLFLPWIKERLIKSFDFLYTIQIFNKGILLSFTCKQSKIRYCNKRLQY